MRSSSSLRSGPRVFTASEVAEYEHCSRYWWYEQYDPINQTDSEVLFAHLVKIEKDYGRQAPAVPEYQVIEQILVRRGAFQAEQASSYEELEQEELAAAVEEERGHEHQSSQKMNSFKLLAVATLTLALLLLLIAWITLAF